MEYEFMTTDTPLPPCMPFPKALAGLPISSTAKVMYCKMLDAMLTKKLEDFSSSYADNFLLYDINHQKVKIKENI